jgi:hypothetical protein
LHPLFQCPLIFALFAGESIPIRLFLSPYDLTPTYKLVHNKFSVKYYLNLVLVDEEDRRYFKQQVIFLFPFRPPVTLHPSVLPLLGNSIVPQSHQISIQIRPVIQLFRRKDEVVTLSFPPLRLSRLGSFVLFLFFSPCQLSLPPHLYPCTLIFIFCCTLRLLVSLSLRLFSSESWLRLLTKSFQRTPMTS